MPSATIPQSPLTRKDLWLGLRWFPAMVLAFFTLFLVYGWAETSGGFGVRWTTAAVPEEFTGFSHTWTLSLIGSLLVISIRKNAYPLVLGLASLAYLIRCEPAFSLYVLMSSLALYPLLGRKSCWSRISFLVLLALVFLVSPKVLVAFELLQPSWFNNVLLMGLLIRYGYCFQESLQPGYQHQPYFETLRYLLFIPQITATLNFSRTDQFLREGVFTDSYCSGWRLLALAVAKIVAYKLIAPFIPGLDEAAGKTFIIWFMAFMQYVAWFLWISFHFDLSIALCRFLGVQIPTNFRFPLLAVSPIDHWRRWNHFNRNILLRWGVRPLKRTCPGHSRYWIAAGVTAAGPVFFQGGWIGTTAVLPDPVRLFSWILFGFGTALFLCFNLRLDRKADLDREEPPWHWRRIPGWLITQSGFAWLFLLVLDFRRHPEGALTPPLTERLQIMTQALGLG